MSGSPARTATAEDLFERRVPPLYHLADDSAAIATACHAMAVRFHGSDTLVVFGNGAAGPDAHQLHYLATSKHVLWELAQVFFEHPDLLAPEVVA